MVDERFRALIEPYAPVRQLGTEFFFTEGPVWHPGEQALSFSDIPASVRRRYAQPDRLRARAFVGRAAPAGRDARGAGAPCEGQAPNSPNDVCVGRDGRHFFTDPTSGRKEHLGLPRPLELGFQGHYRLPPGHRPRAEPQLVSDRCMFTEPNGLCFSPCDRFMWVTDTVQANIRMFDVAPDGRPSPRRTPSSRRWGRAMAALRAMPVLDVRDLPAWAAVSGWLGFTHRGFWGDPPGSRILLRGEVTLALWRAAGEVPVDHG